MRLNWVKSFFLLLPLTITASQTSDLLEQRMIDLRKTKQISNFFFNAELLYFTIQEEGLAFSSPSASIVTVSQIPEAIDIDHGSLQRIESTWVPGFRVGAGYIFPKNLWSLNLDWTQISNSVSHDSTPSDGKVLLPLWLSYSGSFGDHASTSHAKWDIQLKVADLELKRSFWIGNYFSFTPSLGIQSAWVNQIFDIGYQFVPAIIGGIDFSIAPLENIHNRCEFWGTGPSFAIDSRWPLSNHFELFGNLGLALLYGKFDIKFIMTGSELVNIHSDDSIRISRLHSRAALGIAWSTYLMKNRQHLTFTLGWEQQLWLGFNQMDKWSDSIDEFILIEQGLDLTIQGLTIGGRWEF